MGETEKVKRYLQEAEAALCIGGAEQIHITGGEAEIDLAILWALRFVRLAKALNGQGVDEQDIAYARALLEHVPEAYRKAEKKGGPPDA